MKRQTLILVVIAVALFVAGGAIAGLSVIHANKNKTATTVSAVNTPVVVATATIPTGTTGQQMISQGLVAIHSIPAKNYVGTDLASFDALSQTVLTSTVSKGQAIQTTQLTPSTSSIAVPTGMDAVTITLGGTNGLAGYLQPGSRVDVYANITKLSSVPASAAATIPIPCTELAMANIEVLDVSSTSPALGQTKAAGGRTVPPSETVLLAVTPVQSREISFLTINETLSVVQTQKGTLPPLLSQCIGTGQTVTAP